MSGVSFLRPKISSFAPRIAMSWMATLDTRPFRSITPRARVLPSTSMTCSSKALSFGRIRAFEPRACTDMMTAVGHSRRVLTVGFQGAAAVTPGSSDRLTYAMPITQRWRQPKPLQLQTSSAAQVTRSTPEPSTQ